MAESFRQNPRVGLNMATGRIYGHSGCSEFAGYLVHHIGLGFRGLTAKGAACTGDQSDAFIDLLERGTFRVKKFESRLQFLVEGDTLYFQKTD